MELRGRAAMAKIQAGRVSRARHVLTGAPLAPRIEEMFNLLQGRRPQEQSGQFQRKCFVSDLKNRVKLKASSASVCKKLLQAVHEVNTFLAEIGV